MSAILGYAVAVPSPQPKESDDGVLFPPDRAVLLSGSFDVIIKAGEATLEVNGKPQEWEPFEHPLHVAHLRLAPGIHELQFGRRRREIVVAMNEVEHDGPADWAIHRRHPMNTDQDRCSDCHETTEKQGRIAVGKPKSHEACFECHTSVDFDVTHSHPLEPIQHCEICHALHGSDREGLLKAPAKQLCADCHDA